MICYASRYFLTCGHFRFIRGYALTSGVGSWSCGPGNSPSGLYSTSGSTLLLRLPRARDLVTMAEDGPALGRVTAGIGAISRGAGTESDLPDRSVQHSLRFGSESISTTGNY